MIHRRERRLYQAWVGQRMFLWVDPIVFSFWNLTTRSFLRKGSSLVALVQRGSSLDDSRLDPWYFNPGFPAALPLKQLLNLNARLVTTSFSSRKLPQTLLNFLESFLPIKYLEIQYFKLESSFLFHSLTNTLLYSILKALFISRISFLFSFSSFF